MAERLAVYAIGGNALTSPDGSDKKESALVLAKVLSDVVDLLEAGWAVVLTHGNGPQVGELLSLEADHSLDSWVAATQGMIGHELAINLDAILSKRHRPERTAVVLTRVEVDSNDSGFSHPTKPIGPILNDDEIFTNDWDIASTVHGPRRVVASPRPVKVMDIDVIRQLVALRAVVICGGGGGIPVSIDQDSIHPKAAVIDKDLLSAHLAIELQATALVISTGIDAARIGFGTLNEEVIPELEKDRALSLIESGEFPKGSMAPKVSALIEAFEHGVKSVLCQPGDALAALRGEAGTTII